MAPVRDEVQWRWASHDDSEAAYRGYVREWPGGRHVDEARRRYDARSWELAVADGSVSAFERYVEVHPSGRRAGEAHERIEALRWDAAREADTLASLAAYLGDYPDGTRADDARDRVEALIWEDASDTDTVPSLASYLETYPEGRYAAEARRRIDGVHWRDAQAENTVLSYLAYVRVAGRGRFDAHARRRIAALRRSNAPFRAAERAGTRAAFVAFLREFPGHSRAADARASIRELAGVPILDLLADGRIEVKADGIDITQVSVQIRRRVDRPLTVTIPVGTFFLARGSFQSMVATAPEKLTLSDNRWAGVAVSAACANRTRAIPHDGDGFEVLRSPQQAELQRVIPRLRNEEYDVRQAAIWIITDNATHYDLGILVSQYGGRVIGYDDTAWAMMIIDRAGIDITAKAIWRDRADVRDYSEVPEFRRWLRRRE